MSEPTNEQYTDLLSSMWLYIDWRYVTRQLTTDQKNLLADAIDADAGEPVAERWWQWPTCLVCQAPVEPGPGGTWLDIRGKAEQPHPINWAGVGLTPAHAHTTAVAS